MLPVQRTPLPRAGPHIMRILSLLQPYIKPSGADTTIHPLATGETEAGVSYEKNNSTWSFEPRPTNFTGSGSQGQCFGLLGDCGIHRGGTGYNPKNKNNPTIFSDIAAKRPQPPDHGSPGPSAGAMALTRTYLQLNPGSYTDCSSPTQVYAH